MTQIAVAHAFGKPQSFVSKCESGERRIDVVELGAFAHLYQKPLAYFVAETDESTGASVSVDGEAEAGSPEPPPAARAARASRKSGARGSTAAKRSRR